MKSSHTAPRAATWNFAILPYEPDDMHLLEDAPHDEKTRAIWQLVEPVRAWLAGNRHTMTVDRGDFGDGDEHFHLSFTSKAIADEFEALCKSLKK